MQILNGMKGKKYVYLEDEDTVLTFKELAARNAETSAAQNVVTSESVAD